MWAYTAKTNYFLAYPFCFKHSFLYQYPFSITFSSIDGIHRWDPYKTNMYWLYYKQRLSRPSRMGQRSLRFMEFRL